MLGVGHQETESFKKDKEVKGLSEIIFSSCSGVKNSLMRRGSSWWVSEWQTENHGHCQELARSLGLEFKRSWFVHRTENKEQSYKTRMEEFVQRWDSYKEFWKTQWPLGWISMGYPARTGHHCLHSTRQRGPRGRDLRNEEEGALQEPKLPTLAPLDWHREYSLRLQKAWGRQTSRIPPTLLWEIFLNLT